MALDTRGLASGFAQGFGLADNYYTRQEQGERADRRLDMQEETFDMQKEKFQGQQEKEKATFIMGKIANNLMPSDEELQWLKDRPNYLGALNPETDKALEVAQRVIDPNDPLSLNDEEGLYAMNTMFEPMINRGKGGKKRIVAGLPGSRPETMAFELDVEDEDGNHRLEPMTQNRGVAGEDDEVRQVPVGDLVNTAQGYRALRNVINGAGASENAAKVYNLLTGKGPQNSEAYRQTQELQALGLSPEQARDQAYGLGDDGEWERLNNGDLYNSGTGEVRAGVGSQGASAGKAPADVKTAEWMMRVGIAENYDQAWSLLSESNSDPTRFVATYVDQEMKAQENAGLYPGDENYRTTDQMRDAALEALRAIRQQTRGIGQQSQEGGGQPAGLQMLDSSTQALPEDGSAVQAEDGSMQGRVDRSGQQRDEQVRSQPQQPAPPSAVEHLRKNPGLAEQFRAKYGYLPEGF